MYPENILKCEVHRDQRVWFQNLHLPPPTWTLLLGKARGEGDSDSAGDWGRVFPYVPLTLCHASLLSQVPQQDNHCDCGLFLLHYVELFINDPPAIFDQQQLKYKVGVLF
jgi:hypothetical protein